MLLSQYKRETSDHALKSLLNEISKEEEEEDASLANIPPLDPQYLAQLLGDIPHLTDWSTSNTFIPKKNPLSQGSFLSDVEIISLLLIHMPYLDWSTHSHPNTLSIEHSLFMWSSGNSTLKSHCSSLTVKELNLRQDLLLNLKETLDEYLFAMGNYCSVAESVQKKSSLGVLKSNEEEKEERRRRFSFGSMEELAQRRWKFLDKISHRRIAGKKEASTVLRSLSLAFFPSSVPSLVPLHAPSLGRRCKSRSPLKPLIEDEKSIRRGSRGRTFEECKEGKWDGKEKEGCKERKASKDFRRVQKDLEEERLKVVRNLALESALQTGEAMGLLISHFVLTD